MFYVFLFTVCLPLCIGIRLGYELEKRGLLDDEFRDY